MNEIDNSSIHVFVECQFDKADPDFLIIMPNDILIIEHKDKPYTNLSLNTEWTYWDSYNNRPKQEKVRSHVVINPIDQIKRLWNKKGLSKLINQYFSNLYYKLYVVFPKDENNQNVQLIEDSLVKTTTEKGIINIITRKLKYTKSKNRTSQVTQSDIVEFAKDHQITTASLDFFKGNRVTYLQKRIENIQQQLHNYYYKQIKQITPNGYYFRKRVIYNKTDSINPPMLNNYRNEFKKIFSNSPQKTHSVLIAAPMGYGKSVLSYQIALELLKIDRHKPIVPIVMRLREYVQIFKSNFLNDTSIKNVYRLILTIYGRVNSGEISYQETNEIKYIFKYFNKLNFTPLLILDGYDEVYNLLRHQKKRFYKMLIREEYSTILTSRPIALVEIINRMNEIDEDNRKSHLYGLKNLTTKQVECAFYHEGKQIENYKGLNNGYAFEWLTNPLYLRTVLGLELDDVLKIENKQNLLERTMSFIIKRLFVKNINQLTSDIQSMETAEVEKELKGILELNLNTDVNALENHIFFLLGRIGLSEIMGQNSFEEKYDGIFEVRLHANTPISLFDDHNIQYLTQDTIISNFLNFTSDLKMLEKQIKVDIVKILISHFGVKINNNIVIRPNSFRDFSIVKLLDYYDKYQPSGYVELMSFILIEIWREADYFDEVVEFLFYSTNISILTVENKLREHLSKNVAKSMNDYISKNFEDYELLIKLLTKLEDRNIKLFPDNIILKKGKIREIRISGLDKLSEHSTADLLSDIFSDNWKNLQSLSLTNLNLKQIPKNLFQGFDNLKTLNLSSNQIIGFENNQFSSLSNLEYLDISDNKSFKLRPYVFSGLNNLKVLKINSLGLRESYPNTLCPNDGLQDLEELWLTNNQIGSGSDDDILNSILKLAERGSLEFLNLKNNPAISPLDKLYIQPINLDLIIEQNQQQNSYKLQNTLDVDALHHCFNNLNINLDWETLNSSTREHIINKSNIIKLDLSDLNIETIEGIAFNKFESLESLNLSNNLLNDLSSGLFSSLTRLHELDLSDNKLQSIDEKYFIGLNNLKNLDLSQNKINFIKFDAFKPMPNLIELNLTKNSIGKLLKGHFSGLSNLKLLNLTNNDISFIEFGVFNPLSNILELNLSRNRLQKLITGIFNGLNNLQILNLQNNLISYVKFGVFNPFQQLYELDLSKNNLEALHKGFFSGLKSLKMLNLHGNQVKYLEFGVFKPLINLNSLNLSSNSIKSLHKDTFVGLKHLKEIYLSNNYFAFDDSLKNDSLNRLTSLEILDFAYSHVKILPPHLFNQLEYLQLLKFNSNKITQISKDQFVGLHNLETLVFGKNNIKVVDSKIFKDLSNLRTLVMDLDLDTIPAHIFDSLELLRTLRIHRNNLKSLPHGIFRKLEGLERIELQENQLDELEPNLFANNHNLKIIKLYDNNLKKLPKLFALSNLEELYCGQNPELKLQTDQFKGQRELKILTLTACNIQNLPSKTFDSNSNLKILDLTYNNIETLKTRVFGKDNTLEKLRLKFCGLEEIGDQFLENLNHLKSLNLAGNKISTIHDKILGMEKLNFLSLEECRNLPQHQQTSYSSRDEVQELQKILLNLEKEDCDEMKLPPSYKY